MQKNREKNQEKYQGENQVKYRGNNQGVHEEMNQGEDEEENIQGEHAEKNQRDNMNREKTLKNLDEKQFFQLRARDVFTALDTDKKGLSEEEARQRLDQYGKNELVVMRGTPKWLLLLQQFKDVFMIMLLIAAGISFLIANYRDGLVMAAITVINGIIGFLQENKAEEIMASLHKLVQSPAQVVRSGEVRELAQQQLVPGDVIKLEEGDKVPADARIIESFNLRTNDVSLTGESMPQNKNSNRIPGDPPLADRDNMVYLGTTVSSGTATAVVTATGMDTEMGKIASLTREAEKSRSPLQQELQVVANRIAVFAVIIGFFLFGISIYQGMGLNFALIYGLGIAVAVVPQALPMQITVALSQGVNRLAKKNAVVKKLSSVETLGSTDVVATDKTGTLTKNEMTVKNIWFDGEEYDITGLGYKPEGNILNREGEALSTEEIAELEILLDAATMASNAEIHPPDEDHLGWYPVGDPTEAALITLSTKLGTRSPEEDEENPELHEFSFDSNRKRMSSVREYAEGNVLTMKGALNSVLSVAKYIYRDGQEVEITEKDQEMLAEVSENYSEKAMRVIAVAYRKLGPDETDYVLEEIERDVVFLGLAAMIDPPKEGVREAMEQAHQARIDTFIMTGDHATTAQAVGKEISLNLEGGDVPVYTGQQLQQLADDELQQIMEENSALIFSRVSPEDKLRIVNRLKKLDKIVAVTGDGVNDAPALKSAHIGVAMGQMGTDVSKEAAELILLDDSYPTLVHAIREGRTIYNNLKKTVLASLTSNGAELAIVLLGMLAAALFNWPIPILTIQVLSIDLLAEILPLTALTFDPGSRELMTSPPRDPGEHIVNKRSFSEILFLGILMGGLGFLNYALFVGGMEENFTVNHSLYPRATTISYLTIVFCQFVNIMSRRYEFSTIFNRNFFSNCKIVYSVLISIGMVLTVIYLPAVNSYLGFAAVTGGDWLRILPAAAVFLLAHEVIKWFKRRNREEAEVDKVYHSDSTAA